MRIMFINSVVDYGSTGKIVRDIANELKHDGHEVLIAYGRHDTNNRIDTFYFGDKFGTAYHLLMTRAFGRHGMHSKRATQKLISKITEFDPDIINLHNIHGYYLNYPILLEYLSTKDIKIFWTLHDAWAFSGSSAYFDYHGCRYWDQGCLECNSTTDYPKASFKPNQRRNFYLKKEMFTKMKDMTIITPSEWLSNMSVDTFLNKYPIKTIYNGIDLDLFKIVSTKRIKETFQLNNKFVILGLASKWERRKGLNYFVELSDHLTENEVIILVGLDKKQISEMPSNIIGMERTKNIDELVEIYNAADVFMNPTLEDNFPTTNIEALACGTPVITFDTGGSPESIDENTGIVTQEKSVISLFNAKEMIKNSGINYQVTCRKRAESNYSKNIFTEEYKHVFLKGE